jgi:hypothetical protein
MIFSAAQRFSTSSRSPRGIRSARSRGLLVDAPMLIVPSCDLPAQFRDAIRRGVMLSSGCRSDLRARG